MLNQKKNLWLPNFLNLKLNTRLPARKIPKLHVDVSERKEKDLSPKFT